MSCFDYREVKSKAADKSVRFTLGVLTTDD
jgi:hypothetical protein